MCRATVGTDLFMKCLALIHLSQWFCKKDSKLLFKFLGNPKASPTVDLTLHCVEEGVEDDNPLHGFHIVESMPVFPAFWAMRRHLFDWKLFVLTIRKRHWGHLQYLLQQTVELILCWDALLDHQYGLLIDLICLRECIYQTFIIIVVNFFFSKIRTSFFLIF